MSLVASTEEDFYGTVAFYCDLGFVETYAYDRTQPNSRREADSVLASEKETWLHSSGEGEGSDVSLKIRYVTQAAQWSSDRGQGLRDSLLPPKSEAEQKRFDWRAQNQSVVLYTPEMPQIVQLLREKHLAFQCQPNDAHPVEVYTHDPLGTMVGFTTKRNPFASRAGSAPSNFIPTDPMMSATGSHQSSPSEKQKRIGVMTSGGDAPGMNAAVRAVVRMSIAKGCQTYAIYEGYEGLVAGGKLIKRMMWEDVRGYLSEGGTLIGTARSMTFRERAGRLKAAKNLVLNGIDALVICGGDGSLTGADLFRSEWAGLVDELLTKGELSKEQAQPYRHLNIVGLVGSIDNDLTGTDATIGCYSSLTRICQAVDFIDATAQSHSRAFVVEVMGRHCGWLALMSAVSTGADFVFMPEKPPSKGWEQEMCAIVTQQRQFGKRKTIVIVAEGAIDDQLNPITATQVKKVLAEDLGLDTRITTLGHLQRGGTAVYYDRMLATLQGCEAVNAVLESTPDTPSPVITINENKIERKPLMEAVKLVRPNEEG